MEQSQLIETAAQNTKRQTLWKAVGAVVLTGATLAAAFGVANRAEHAFEHVKHTTEITGVSGR